MINICLVKLINLCYVKKIIVTLWQPTGYPKLRYFSDVVFCHLNKMADLMLFTDILRENEDLILTVKQKLDLTKFLSQNFFHKIRNLVKPAPDVLAITSLVWPFSSGPWPTVIFLKNLSFVSITESSINHLLFKTEKIIVHSIPKHQ